MLWIVLEALLALALLLGAVAWVMWPSGQKKGRGAKSAAPEKPPAEEREREKRAALEEK